MKNRTKKWGVAALAVLLSISMLQSPGWIVNAQAEETAVVSEDTEILEEEPAVEIETQNEEVDESAKADVLLPEETGIDQEDQDLSDSVTEVLEESVAETGSEESEEETVTATVSADPADGTEGSNDAQERISIKSAEASVINDRTYDGTEKKPRPDVTLNGKKLKNGRDYQLSYSHNKNAGTATIKIKGINKYKDSFVIHFIIKPASIKKASVSKIKKKVTYTGKKIKQVPVVKKSGVTLKAGRDYEVTYKKTTSVGKSIILIKGKGNYTGTIKKTFLIWPRPTTIYKSYGERGKIRLDWKRKKKQVSGYQIRVSTDRYFKKNVKKVLVKGNSHTSATVKGLKEKTPYYIQVRTYKADGEKKYFSAWSKKKKVATLSSEVPVAPVLNSIDWASGSKISIRWTVVSGAEGYILYRSTKKYGTYEAVQSFSGNQNVRAVLVVPTDKIYYYQVKAYRYANGELVKGEVSNALANVKYADSNLGELFPSGPPTSSSEMQKYLVTVTLPVRTASGGKSYIHLPIHKKLESRVKACFEEMYEAGFVVRASDTGSYNWRKMRTVDLMSHHAYGCAIDINWDANPMATLSQIGHCAYKPESNRYSIPQEIVEIWKKHGFYWGGDWTEKKDYMHMSYTND